MRLTTALFSYAGYLGILFASSLFAQNTLLDDHSDKTASNEFGAKWHYYDDAMGTGKDDRPQAAPGSEASVINVTFTTKARHAFGNPNDQWAIKEYTLPSTQLVIHLLQCLLPLAKIGRHHIVVVQNVPDHT